jgi:hypothetical protein
VSKCTEWHSVASLMGLLSSQEMLLVWNFNKMKRKVGWFKKMLSQLCNVNIIILFFLSLFSDSNFFALAEHPVALASTSLTSNTEVSGLAGQTVLLPCHLSPDTCGKIHSIKWYRGDHRVYIFSELAAISKAEDDLTDR